MTRVLLPMVEKYPIFDQTFIKTQDLYSKSMHSTQNQPSQSALNILFD